MMRIAFLASHNGSSARAITKACRDERLSADPVLMISNNPDSAALAWAREEGLDALCLNAKNCGDADGVDAAIAQALKKSGADMVVCSGYMKLVGPQAIAAMPGRILNVHPALLPKYGGQGMYGRRVHEAVVQNGESETGITIHLVDAVYDHGAVVAQKTVSVFPGDTAEDVENRVKDAEPEFYIETLQEILSGAITLN